MNYIVFDLEWNQAQSKEQAISQPIKLSGEIIQIGAIKLDRSFEIIDRFEIMVRPVYYTQMNSKVKQLTGISQEDIEGGMPFETAYKSFLKFCGDNFCYMTWGNDDIGILLSNIRIHKMSLRSFPSTYNLQRIYGRQIAKVKGQVSLEDAVASLGEPPYKAHNALSDAMSTALVCKHLDMSIERPTVVSLNTKKKTRRSKTRRGKNRTKRIEKREL